MSERVPPVGELDAAEIRRLPALEPNATCGYVRLMMPPDSEVMVHFVNYWLDLRRADGMRQREVSGSCRLRQAARL